MRFYLAFLFLVTARVAFADASTSSYSSWINLPDGTKGAALNAELDKNDCQVTPDKSDKFAPDSAPSNGGAMDSESLHYSSERCKVIETSIKPVEACPVGTKSTRAQMAKTPGYKICVKISEPAPKSSAGSSGKSGS